MSLKTTWGNLRSMERRIVIGIAVLLFLVINIFWVWPRFGDWNATQTRLSDARGKLKLWQKEVDTSPKIQKLIGELEKIGGSVSSEDQANNFARAIQSQAVQSGVNIISSSKQQWKTNEFFLELIQTFSVQSREENLVDFLYNLGEGSSLIRVRDISLRPDAPREKIGGNIKLVASYQKKPPVKSARAADKTDKKPATTKKP